MTVELLVTSTEVIEVIESGPKGENGAVGGTGSNIGAILVAFSASYVDQNPVGLDNPYTIVFDTVDVVAPDASILSDGSIVIHNAGYYTISLIHTLGRDNNNGTSQLITWGEVDGNIPAGVPSVEFEFDNSKLRVSSQFQNNIFLPAGTVVNAMIARNGDGADDGGLKSREVSANLAAAGVQDVASATCSVYKLRVV